MECHDHSPAHATHQCNSCRRGWCDHCLVALRNTPHIKMCPRCRDLATRLSDRRGRDEATFFADVVSAFRYPLLGAGAIMIVAGSVVFALLDLLSVVPFVGWIAALAGSGYLVAYYSRVISSSADGDDELPDWPDFVGWFEDIINPFFRAVAVVVAGLLPAVLAWSLGLESLVPLLAGAGALLYMPVAWMSVSIHESVLAANPLVVLGVAARAPSHYLIASILFVATAAGTFALQAALSASLIGIAVSYLVGLYGMFVAMRVLGLLYFHNSEELNWFGERGIAA